MFDNIRELHKEVVGATSTIRKASVSIKEIHDKLLTNLEYGMAGAPLPYDYNELHAEAEALRNEIKEAPQKLTDEAALTAPNMFPTLDGSGALVKAGTRINHNGLLYRAASDLWDYEYNTPVNAPTLWELVTYKNGIRDIPEVITVTSAFYKGELGYWNGAIYESLLDNNVYTPEAYPSGWLLKG